MYKSAAFLISSAALTSIFSFFFGGYFRERERACRLWLMIVAYGKEIPLLYIRVAVDRTERFPFFRIRPRVTGQDRVSKIWMLLECSKLKTPEYSQNRIPRTFYDNQDYYSNAAGSEKRHLIHNHLIKEGKR